MLHKYVIESDRSPWASPVVIVQKKDGFIRFCVDYRKLQKNTHFNFDPLLRIDEETDARGLQRSQVLYNYWSYFRILAGRPYTKS